MATPVGRASYERSESANLLRAAPQLQCLADDCGGHRSEHGTTMDTQKKVARGIDSRSQVQQHFIP